jgi:xylan 1,4-beta-xylosidase
VLLRVEVDDQRLLFAYSLDGAAWHFLPEIFDASILSDEAATPATANFTGAFVGLCCQDTAGTALHADFAWFEYVEREFLADPVTIPA